MAKAHLRRSVSLFLLHCWRAVLITVAFARRVRVEHERSSAIAVRQARVTQKEKHQPHWASTMWTKHNKTPASQSKKLSQRQPCGAEIGRCVRARSSACDTMHVQSPTFFERKRSRTTHAAKPSDGWDERQERRPLQTTKWSALWHGA